MNTFARVIHQREAFRQARHGHAWTICGQLVRERYVTTLGWKVTCDSCNPKGGRRQASPPAPVGPSLELT
ncbi:hypothetical protein TMCBR2_gp027c [Caulobacter phage TMCBR2]|uniref:Uncharacterized protein n=1 Tax=Caulobacter phage TMCBR2 TaxID=3025404 RepID=A0AAE9YKK3_9CAUD|nr:hypothetical protein TMCBR2_gp027c [Caulobacter phage TMCBR2]WDS38275.1 hypothetical protein TMCBR3_gp027c [Caulobacter phage TMCBR3]